MNLIRKAGYTSLVLWGALVVSPYSVAQISPYVYVKMSLGVPWFLYFVFLACILLPFFVLIAIAWRRYFIATREGRDKHSNLEDF